MNEQQLADIFSEQLDLLLNGQSAELPAEAAELQELLGFGQQVAGVQFLPGAAAQAAFQGQLATWFPAGAGMPGAVAATVLGIPKNLAAILLVAGGGLGLAALLGLTALVMGNVDPTPEPTTRPAPTTHAPAAPPNTLPAASPTGDESSPKSQQSGDQLPGQGRSNSAGDTVDSPKPASAGDTLPTQPPAIAPTEALTPTTSPVITPGMVTSPTSGGDDSASPGGGGDDSASPGGGDDDRGHGNDPGGFDPDNPGNSTGVGGGQDNAPNLGRGGEGGSSSGNNSDGNNSGGNSGNSGNSNKGKNKDK